jgi:hypothetical protein
MTKQSQITHIPKSVLAMAGIVIALVQIAVALPLHIMAYFRTEPTVNILKVECGILIVPMFFFLLISIVQMGERREQRALLSALRARYGWPRWIWSRSYRDEQLKIYAPYAPLWMGWLADAFTLYALIVLVASLFLLNADYRAGREFIHYSTLLMSVPVINIDLQFLPILISMWRESRLQSLSASQV